MGSEGLPGACQSLCKQILPGRRQGPGHHLQLTPGNWRVLSQGGPLLIILPQFLVHSLFLLFALSLVWDCLLSQDPQAGFPSGNPHRGQKPTSTGLQKWMRPHRTRANLCCKMEICTTDQIFQPRIPLHKHPWWRFSLDSFVLLPAQLCKVSWPLVFSNRKNQTQGKAAFWNLRLEILKVGDQNIYNRVTQPKSPVCSSHPGLDWAGPGVWGLNTELFPLLPLLFPNLHRQPSLILPSWIKAPF